MHSIESILAGVKQGHFLALARALTLVENELEGSTDLLRSLTAESSTPVFGITGPPGAGKSTLVNALIELLSLQGKKVAILAVDPTSPFNFGSLLGDRIRMSQQFNNPSVFIRSVATRGALGGISTKTIEMVDVMRAAGFDYIFVETVGVGQSELEIAGLADRTVVVLVPESGDEIQHIKSGLMEVAQAFAVNKADREGAEKFANNLKKLVRHQQPPIPVFKTVADKKQGISALCDWLQTPSIIDNSRKPFLMAEKAFKLLQQERMRDIDKIRLLNDIKLALLESDFNIYRFIDTWR
ncbi:MAG: transporter [Pedobacter sp.]|jgi:LAO/AO transport system kinase|nr:transporter [Pedobacter sp.]